MLAGDESLLLCCSSSRFAAQLTRVAAHVPYDCCVTACYGCYTGRMVYHGPRKQVVPFFEQLGFGIPERKGVADFIQEICSEKDQEVSHEEDALKV